MPRKLRCESIRTSELSLDPANLKLHPQRSIDGLVASLRRFGQPRPILVDQRGIVIAGNGILAAALVLGWTHVEAVRTPMKGVEATAYAITDNRTAELSKWDEPALTAILAELKAEDAELFEATGFDDSELSAMLDAAGEVTEGAVEVNEVPPLPATPETRLGDLITLGDHRLICGDASDPAVLARLMRKSAADCLWTDPPYGVSYEGKTARKLRIKGDDTAGLETLLRGAFTAANAVLKAGAPVYVAHPAGANAVLFSSAFLDAGWSLHQTLVWRKDAFVLGHSDYHYQHEPILYGHSKAQGRVGRGGRHWYGDNAQASVLDVPRPRSNEEHPTAKPVALIEIALGNSTRRGEIVLDPFAGSGSTLIAAARNSRHAHLVELDPAYCDVIVARWESFTGRKSKRQRAKGSACA